jgi:DNA-binding SARP family transcriptional activator
MSGLESKEAPVMADRVGFRVLGPVRVLVHDAVVDLGVPQQRAVLVALLLRDGAQATVDQLVDDVWGQSPPRTAVASLRTYVYRLRQIIEDGRSALIRSVAGGMPWPPTPTRWI